MIDIIDESPSPSPYQANHDTCVSPFATRCTWLSVGERARLGVIFVETQVSQEFGHRGGHPCPKFDRGEDPDLGSEPQELTTVIGKLALGKSETKLAATPGFQDRLPQIGMIQRQPRPSRSEHSADFWMVRMVVITT